MLKRHATYCYNFPCSTPLGTSLSSAWMVPEQWRTTSSKMAEPQPLQLWTTTLPDQQLPTSTLSLSWSLPGSSPCLKSWVLNPTEDARRLWSLPVRTVPLIPLDQSISSTYCRHSLMQHKPFRQVSELLVGHETNAEAYAEFLQAGNIPHSLEEDIFHLQQLQATQHTPDNEVMIINLLCVHCICFHGFSTFTLGLLQLTPITAMFLCRRSKGMSNPHSIDQQEHMRSGCLSVNALVTCSRTSAHRQILTGQQQLSPTPTWRRLLHLLPDIVSRPHHVCSPHLLIQTTCREHS